ncbi:MAG: rhomboid family intramembrane serine protease [Candidatus Aenigmarchaeota archaeon]|nr:rhomboid family intramembrane serine protease [Candidatus Aenigmarchaeota archaeon]
MILKLNWTLIFLVIAVLVFLLQSINIFDFDPLAFTPSLAFVHPWTFITSMFLHADTSHIFFNMFALVMFGLPLEKKIGSKKFLMIFFISGIAGGIGYMVTAQDLSIPAIGMSGAIYGIMGTLALLMPGSLVFVGGFAPMPMIVAVFFWGMLEFLGLFSPGVIARGAHLGGLFTGVLYGIYLRIKEAKSKPKEDKIELTGYADWER